MTRSNSMIAALILSFFCSHIVYGITSLQSVSKKTSTSVRYLETNSWSVIVNYDMDIAIDPVLAAPLDFGIPLLYSGKKKFIDGKAEMQRLVEKTDYILLSQGLDDHAHGPTLKQLAKLRPNMPYIVAPSALPVLLSCGISSSCITTLMPGRSIELTKANKKVTITATKGALVGPPWQATENGYIVRPEMGASFYYEPHCMYDESELSRLGPVDYVITPIVSQELPFFTLVAGGDKAVKLAQILKAKAIVPMANGELDQSGVLALLVRSEGSEQEFVSSLKAQSLKVLKVIPGEPIYLSN